jgi:hypothetical protein
LYRQPTAREASGCILGKQTQILLDEQIVIA